MQIIRSATNILPCSQRNIKVPIIKPTRCTNISNLFLEWNSTCFGQFLCPTSGVFHCTHSNGIYHTGLLTAREPVWHIPLLCVQWQTPDDGQRSCPKHVEFYSKNKFEKSLHLVGFIVRAYQDGRSPERQIQHKSVNTEISCHVSIYCSFLLSF